MGIVSAFLPYSEGRIHFLLFMVPPFLRVAAILAHRERAETSKADLLLISGRRIRNFTG